MNTPARRARLLAIFSVTILVTSMFLSIPQLVAADTDLEIGGEARVSYTDGDDIMLRDEPTYSGAVITSVPEGWLVAVLDGPLEDEAGNSWYQVTARGQNGYMVSDYLVRVEGTAAAPTETLPAEPSSQPAAEVSPADIIADAWVIDGSLNLRAGPGTGTAVLTVMPGGSQVGVTGNSESGFTPVQYNGIDGWAYSDYLSSTAPGSNPSPSSGTVIETRYATVNLNLRSGAGLGFNVLTVIPRNGEVGITGSDQNGYFPVRYNGTEGFAAASYLATTAPGSNEPPPSSGNVIETRYATANLNLRSGAGLSFGVLTVIPNDGEVGITGSEQNGYLPVRYNDIDGFAAASYLTTTAPGNGEPPPSSGTVIETQYATSSLNLRSGAGLSFSVLTVIPRDGEVGITGGEQNGYLPVRYNGIDGFSAAAYLTTDEPEDNTPAPPSNTVVETRYATANLNLRSGAGLSFGVLTVIPEDGEVDITGSEQNGYFPVRYNGTDGFAASAYLTTEEPGSSDPPPSTTIVETRYTTVSLNMRSGAGLSFNVLTVIPQGAEVDITGNAVNSYYPVRYDGTNGWAATNYLVLDEPGSGPGSGTGGGSLIWPISGGTWEIIQGYNGGTHNGGTYNYSLDLAKVGGGTAGTSVVAPASGTVAWTSGGLLIDMGNGYGIAMFHITIANGISRGTQVSQGQYVGFISGPGGVGYQVTPHVDLTLWELPNGGGYPRISTPYSGGFPISGFSFPPTGAYNDYGGTRFTP